MSERWDSTGCSRPFKDVSISSESDGKLSEVLG